MNAKSIERILTRVGIAIILSLTCAIWADIPAPPVNQDIGMPDVAIGDLTEGECRVCHSAGIPDRHHLLYNQPIVPNSLIPFPDSDNDGTPDSNYRCLSCHDENFTVVRDCITCHTESPHHTTPAAMSRNCVACHGDIVDNYDDGHYIPTYSPSSVTPSSNFGTGLPLNSRGLGAGACNYCHDNDGLDTPVILTNQELHHSVSSNCNWCHSSHGAKIRRCEDCHGPDSLHSIQADSPKEPNGTIVVGGEDAGYGHVGRDAGPGDSDCWGCHGFAAATTTPMSNLLVPTIYSSHPSVVETGIDTLVVLSGSAFTNMTGHTRYEAKAVLTAADGSSVTISPKAIEEKLLTVTIPSNTTVGNYNLQVVKTDSAGNRVASNPTVISVVPKVIITEIRTDEILTIVGRGFGGYAQGAVTSVTGKVVVRKDNIESTQTVTAMVLSWSDTVIKVEFDACPQTVTVNSIYGTDTAEVVNESTGRMQ